MNFFLLHFDQTVGYLAILILLFYMEDRWAYGRDHRTRHDVCDGTAGRRTPADLEHRARQGDDERVSFLAAVSAALNILIIAVCGRHSSKEYSGLGKWASRFAVSFGIVAVYCGILVVWFWHMLPFSAAQN